MGGREGLRLNGSIGRESRLARSVPGNFISGCEQADMSILEGLKKGQLAIPTRNGATRSGTAIFDPARNLKSVRIVKARDGCNLWPRVIMNAMYVRTKR